MGAATLHVLTAGAWIGGLFHLWRSARVASDATLLALVRAFHAVALTAVALLASSGLYQTFKLLGSFANLFSTPWGLLFVVKQLFVLSVLALGYGHWRRSEQAVSAGERVSLRASLGRELLLACTVIAVTSVLTSIAPPE